MKGNYRSMSLFSIADLHLSFSAEKPMDIFGKRWTNHAEKLEKRWRAVVSENDTVVVPGDISWALSLDEARADLEFIDSLPGKKLIGKGNHDYWWGTLTKMKAALLEWGTTSIDFLYNNAIAAEGYVICGTRGWYIEEKYQNTPAPADYDKIVAREAARLELSLIEAEKIANGRTILAYFHFPPVYRNFVCRELIAVLEKHGITNCYYGHIHGAYTCPRTVAYKTGIGDIFFTMISADYLDFIPMITMPLDY